MSAELILLVLMPESGDGVPRAYYVRADERASGSIWHEAEPEREAADLVVLALPTALTTLHRFSLPGLTTAQAQAAAARHALEASINPEHMHVAAGADGNGTAVAATIARTDMERVLRWTAEHGVDPDMVLPVGLLVPAPAEGFACARIGDQLILRSADMALNDNEPMADILTEGQAVHMLDAQETHEIVASALAAPALNLLSGPFARSRSVSIDLRVLKRAALWAGAALALFFLTMLAQILKYHWDASRLDQDSVALAQPFVTGPTDADSVEQQLARKLAATGSIGATGSVAALVRAMQAGPTVSLTLLSRGNDGLLRATLAASRAEDINPVLIAIQNAGFRITATSTSDPGGRVLAEITVES